MLANVYVRPANHDAVVRVARLVSWFVSATELPSDRPGGSVATGPIATPPVNDACDPNRSADPM